MPPPRSAPISLSDTPDDAQPLYETLDDLPEAPTAAMWDRLIERLKAHPSLQFFTDVSDTDIDALTPEQSPLLVVVRVTDGWERENLGGHYGSNWLGTFGFGLRAYLYHDPNRPDTERKTMDTVDRMTQVLIRVLRGATFQKDDGHWYYLDPDPDTTIYDLIGERAFSTSRIHLRRRFERGT